MNGKMTTNSQLLTAEPKNKIKNKNNLSKQLEQGTESQKWRSHGGLSVGKWEGEWGGKGTENQ